VFKEVDFVARQSCYNPWYLSTKEFFVMSSKAKQKLSLYTLVLLVLPALALACRITIPSGQSPAPVEVVKTVVVTVEPSSQQRNEISQLAQPVQVVSENEQLVDLYARVNPAVVNITNYIEGDNNQLVRSSQGSGFLYDNLGHIVTNAHVIHGASEVEVTFSDGSTRTSEIVGEDMNSDLAVVLVKDMPSGIQPLQLADMSSLAVGQTVLAIGNPFGLEGTLTRGIISALGRNIPALTPFSIPQSIQTDAAINPGNSGGPLLDLNGEVIGVNAQIETDGQSNSNLGVGFAIPVSIVNRVVPDLVQFGEHKWSWLGVQGGDVTPLLVEAMNLPVDKGAYLAGVLSSGPSDKAGMRGADETRTIRGHQVSTGGDIITAINGQPVNSFDDLLIYIALQTAPGDDVTLNILRDGKPMEVVVKLEERPSSLDSFTLP
jgi:S1-C subfamily serine protease